MCVRVRALRGGVEEGQILGSSAELFTAVKRQEKWGGGGGGVLSLISYNAQAGS